MTSHPPEIDLTYQNVQFGANILVLSQKVCLFSMQVPGIVKIILIQGFYVK